MKTSPDAFAVLLEKAEKYGQTSLELFKLKALEKASDTLSKLFVYVIAATLILLFAIVVNIGIALWIGDLFKKTYYGFFCVAGFYAIVGGVLFFWLKKSIKTKVDNSIITKMLN